MEMSFFLQVHCLTNYIHSFPNERFCSKTCFEIEVRSTSEMAYRLRPFVNNESGMVLLVIFLFFFGNKV